MSALTVPWCTYTDPEVAHVGLYVKKARQRGIPVKTFAIPMHDVDRAIADSEDEGLCVGTPWRCTTPPSGSGPNHVGQLSTW